MSHLSPSVINYAMVTLLFGLICRSVAVQIALCGSQFNLKEKLFIALAWLPKATVQAAFGPVALDIARSRDDAVAANYAMKVLTVAVLSILITAPIGAVCIAVAGPKLLSYDGDDVIDDGTQPDDKRLSNAQIES